MKEVGKGGDFKGRLQGEVLSGLSPICLTCWEDRLEDEQKTAGLFAWGPSVCLIQNPPVGVRPRGRGEM